MGVQYDKTRRKYVVRWREDGRQRNRRFATQEAAETFNETLHRRRARPSEPVAPIVRPPPEPQLGDGVYAYQTKDGRRWRFTFCHADGSTSSRRGFTNLVIERHVRKARPVVRRRRVARGAREPVAEHVGDGDEVLGGIERHPLADEPLVVPVAARIPGGYTTALLLSALSSPKVL